MSQVYNEDIFDESYTLEPLQLSQIEKILEDDLVIEGMQNILLIDMYGNIISKFDDESFDRDLYALAALSSANFAAVSTMAKIIGEDEFSSLFHKGVNGSVYFRKVNKDFILVVIFGDELPIGTLRMNLESAIAKIRKISF